MQKRTIESPVKVYETNEYDKFRKLVGNRDVTAARVSKIIESVRNVGYITSPITVNEKLEVIDGQARVEAFKTLGIPVQYVIHKGASIRECMQMNIKQTNWSLADFVESYAAQGDKNYQRLVDIKKTYPYYSYSEIISIGYGWTHTGGGASSIIKNGALVITDSIDARIRTTIKELNKYRSFITAVGGRKDCVLSALRFCIEHSSLDNERLLTKVMEKKDSYKSSQGTSVEDIIRWLEKTYNANIPSKKVYLTTEYDQFLLVQKKKGQDSLAQYREVINSFSKS